MRRSSNLLKGALAAGLCLSASIPAAAKDIYVNDDATGGKGTKDAPLSTIWQAMQIARTYDVIHVAAGEYNGKDGFAHFPVQSPYLTIVGGYDETFNSRNPFENMSIIRSASKHTAIEGYFDYKYTPGKIESARGFTIDGFLFDGSVDNSNKEMGLVPQGSRTGSFIHLRDTNDPWRTANIKIRNCMFINSNLEPMVSNTWTGTDNEITNCLFVGMMYAGIDLANATKPRTSLRGLELPDPYVSIDNVTMAFGFFHKRMNGSYAINVGSSGSYSITDSVFAYIERDGGAENGTAINSQRGNDNIQVKDNVFFQVYKPAPFIDATGSSQLAPAIDDGWGDDDDDWGDEDDTESASAGASGKTAENNQVVDPGIKPNVEYFDKVSYRVVDTFVDNGKKFFEDIDTFKTKRSELGLSEVKKGGLGMTVYNPIYPIDEVIPNFVATVAGNGIQTDGPFETYSAPPENDSDKLEWVKATSAELLDFPSANNGQPTQLRGQINGFSTRQYRFPEAEGSPYDYQQVEIWVDGEQANKMDGYILDGSTPALIYNENGKGMYDIRAKVYRDPQGQTKAKAVAVIELIRARD